MHLNVIVLITPKEQGESGSPNLWKQEYVLPNGKIGRSAREATRKMLAPYGFVTRASRPAGVAHCIGWDGYWIGGAWGGQFDPQYDLMQDPRNQQRCTMCRGTGQSGVSRSTPSAPDAEVVCEECHGTGRCAKSASQWTPVDGHIAPVARLPKNLDA